MEDCIYEGFLWYSRHYLFAVCRDFHSLNIYCIVESEERAHWHKTFLLSLDRCRSRSGDSD
jgi:hypothetical protein